MAEANGNKDEPFNPWFESKEECLRHYGVDSASGLPTTEVESRREKHGWNELEKETGKPMWKLVMEQFDDTLVKILLAAAAISFILAYIDGRESGESGLTAYVEPLVILTILVLNAIVGVWQESNAERALEALKEMQSETAKVLRDGSLISDLPSRELVPGDIVELRVGDKVPADMRIIRLLSSTLRAEQSSLTGESMAVLKGHAPLDSANFGDKTCELQAKECMVFAGTTIANGSSLNLVTHTGMGTEIGKIQSQIAAAAEEEGDTPLKQKLDEFGERLTAVIGAVCLLVWLINYKYFFSWDAAATPAFPWSYLPYPFSLLARATFSFAKCTYYFKIAVALAVAAIPEGLPAVITTCLALGTRKMAAKNAIVRKLPSVETLGCTTVICSDKTGTLTTNQMSVSRLITCGRTPDDFLDFEVLGTTFSPSDGRIMGLERGVTFQSLQGLAEVAAVCNDAGLASAQSSSSSSKRVVNPFAQPDGALQQQQGQSSGGIKATGLPTEAALRVLVEKIGVPDSTLQASINAKREVDPMAMLQAANNWWQKRHPRVAVLEFDRARKSMGVLVSMKSSSSSSGGGRNRLLVKGAVENVLERCSHQQLADGSIVALSPSSRSSISSLLDSMSSLSLRCLAFAFKDDLGQFSDYSGEAHPAHKLLLDPANYAVIESGMVFVGMVGLRDPPRKEVRAAVQDCISAGIRVMVITGDNKNTAEAICREIGVFGPQEADGQDLSKKSFTGREFLDLPVEKRLEVLGGTGGRVFSRAEPGHKQDIVRMLRELGEVVAMTGDGVNDAPALKLADIGIAMGIAGTEVAKEAADMVLADDNFSTIVAAVAEGRSIYNNMKAFIRYMISSNMGEVASIFLTAALGMPEGLIPVQLLWVNLVTDGPPATALGFNPPDEDIMRKPPRRSDDKLITPWVLFRYVVIGMYVGIATVGVFAIWYTQSSFLGIDLSSDGHSLVSFKQLRNWDDCPNWQNFTAAPFTAGSKTISFGSNPCDYFEAGKIKAATLSLSVLVSIEMFNSLNALSEDSSLVTMPPWVNPWLLLAMSVSFALHFLILYMPFLADIFGIVPLSFNEWLLVFVVSFPVILLDEGLKMIGRWMSRKEQEARKLKLE